MACAEKALDMSESLAYSYSEELENSLTFFTSPILGRMGFQSAFRIPHSAFHLGHL